MSFGKEMIKCVAVAAIAAVAALGVAAAALLVAGRCHNAWADFVAGKRL